MAFEVQLQGRAPQKFDDGRWKVIEGGVLEVTERGGGKTLFSPNYWTKVTADPRKLASPLADTVAE